MHWHRKAQHWCEQPVLWPKDIQIPGPSITHRRSKRLRRRIARWIAQRFHVVIKGYSLQLNAFVGLVLESEQGMLRTQPALWRRNP